MIKFLHDVRAILGFEGGTRARVPKATRILVILFTKFFPVLKNLGCLGFANFFQRGGYSDEKWGYWPGYGGVL